MPELQSDVTAADSLVHRLVELGVTTIFALPGEENLPVVSALRTSPLAVVVCRHEQHAGFMAVMHARLTGGLGVVLATLGPGALNTFTPIAQSLLLRVPLLVITGQKNLRDNTEGGFQVIDVIGAATPITKMATTLVDPEVAAVTLSNLVHVANAAPAGPVVLEVPEDVASAAVNNDSGAAASDLPADPIADPVSVGEVLSRVRRAERPLILAGSGAVVPHVTEALRRLVARAGLPVLATQMGKGSIDERSEHSVRTLGIHRSDHTHAALAACDLILTVGYHTTEHPPLAWNRYGQPVIHIGRSVAAIEPGYSPVLQLIGDPGPALDGLTGLAKTRWWDTVRSSIIEGLDEERSIARARRSTNSDPLSVIEAVEEVLDQRPDLVVALDNGAYKVWFARHFASPGPQSLFLDNALATMGAGLASGTEAARLGHSALVVCGDGGFMMNLGDFETACRLGNDLVVLVVRDDRYGFIAWHQDEQDRERSDVDVTNPDLRKLAESFGATGSRIDHWSDLASELQSALDGGGVHLIDCPIDYAINDLMDPNTLPDFPKSNKW